MSLRTHLFLGYLAVVLLGMGLAALLAWRSVESLYLETQRQNLLAQAKLAAAALEGQPLPTGAQPYAQSANALPGVHSRLLAEQGGVLLSLPLPAGEQPAPPAENQAAVTWQELLSRSEVSQALAGQPATAVREAAAAGGRRVLYAAAPVRGADGGVSGLVYLATPLPPGGLPADLLWKLLGAVLLAMLLAAAAGTLLARRIARPVEAIARAAAGVGAERPELRLPPGHIRELEALRQAFEAMTGRLRQADQAKNAFIADVTHELRTPLTVIKGTAETLEDNLLDDPQGARRLLAAMQGETDRLIRLVNELLVLARCDAGALKLDVRPLDLEALARQRCAALAPLAARRPAELVVVVPAPLPPVPGDADRLAQVLDNLLDNAIRYSPPGGQVTVSLDAAGGECCCQVSDLGPGIPAQHLPLIFERFYRLDASRSRHSGGAGLGLAIVRALVQAHGGRVAAESAGNQGTTFSFFLPLDENWRAAAAGLTPS